MSQGLQNVIRKRFKSIQLQTLSKTFYKGEYTKSWSDSETVNMTLIPVGMNELKFYPEGTVTAQDMKIYTDQNLDLKIGSRFMYDGNQYEIKNDVYRSYGDFSMYLGRRTNDSIQRPS